jgi:hypothetical protein
MNKIHLVSLAFIVVTLLFFSCTERDESTSGQRLYSISLELKKDVEILPFSGTKSIPTYIPSEPQAIEKQESAPLFSRLEYIVYHKESGALVKSQSFTEENSDDFGVYVYDELEAGTYLIALLAHSASGMTLSGNQAAFSEVTDSFHAIKEVTVGPESEENTVEIILKRLVARVEFAGTKAIPDDASKFVLEIEEQYHTTNLKDAEAATVRALKKEYLLSGGVSPGEAFVYSFYTFVPEPLQGDTSYLSGVKLITLNQHEDTLHTIRLTSVPVIKNRVTRYTGSLYASKTNSNTLELEIEDYGHWKDTINVPF